MQKDHSPRRALPPPPVSQQFDLADAVPPYPQARKPLPVPPAATQRPMPTPAPSSHGRVPSQTISDEKRAYAEAVGIDISVNPADQEVVSPDSMLPSYQDREPDEREGLAKSDRSSSTRSSDQDLKTSTELEQVRQAEEEETDAQVQMDDMAQKAAAAARSRHSTTHDPGWDDTKIDGNVRHQHSTLDGSQRVFTSNIPFPCTPIYGSQPTPMFQVDAKAAFSPEDSQPAAFDQTWSSNHRPESLFSRNSFDPAASSRSGPFVTRPSLPWMQNENHHLEMQTPKLTARSHPTPLVRPGGLSRLEQSTDPATLAKLKRSMTSARGFYGAGIGSAAYGSELEVVFESGTTTGQTESSSRSPVPPASLSNISEENSRPRPHPYASEVQRHYSPFDPPTQAIVFGDFRHRTSISQLPPAPPANLAPFRSCTIHSSMQMYPPLEHARPVSFSLSPRQSLPPPLPPLPQPHAARPVQLVRTGTVIGSSSSQIPVYTMSNQLPPAQPLPQFHPPPLPPAPLAYAHPSPRATPSPAPSHASFQSTPSRAGGIGRGGTFKRWFGRGSGSRTDSVDP
ncbi:hypothetical protein ACM66B_007022 [Microbotryomycetes sp. NB124-2]